MSYFGIPLRNGLMLGLGSVASLNSSSQPNIEYYYLAAENGDILTTEAGDKILLEQSYVGYKLAAENGANLVTEAGDMIMLEQNYG